MQQPASALRAGTVGQRATKLQGPLPSRSRDLPQQDHEAHSGRLSTTRSRTPPRPLASHDPQSGQRPAIATSALSERQFGVDADGTFYYGADQEEENDRGDTFKQVLSRRSSFGNADFAFTFTSHPPAFGLPPSPPMSPSAMEPQTGGFHDGLHESAAAAESISNTFPFELEAGAVPTVFVNGAEMSASRRSTATNGRRSSVTDPYNLINHQRFSRDQRMPQIDLIAPDDAALLHPGLIRQRSLDNRLESDAMLQIPIPSHRLGTPRIGTWGSIYLQSTSDLDGQAQHRASKASGLTLDDVFPAPPSLQQGSPYLDVSNTASRQALAAVPAPPEAVGGVDPSIYDAFVDDPDSPQFIKYLPSGRILAATPARLIAQTTSVRFLDYDLLSDFFLTYRSFISGADLLRYLVARLTWAFYRGEKGRVVRVRAFVAIRHWILNYFMDDFHPNDTLRELFCVLINKLSRDLWKRHDRGGGDMQIVGELKKCWRRTCDIIWQTHDGERIRSPVEDIYPMINHAIQPPLPIGGTEANDFAATNFESADARPKPTSFEQQTHQSAHHRINSWDPIEIASIASSIAGAPLTPFRLRQDSLDVTSCSFPIWTRIGRALPSFRPKPLMPAHGAARPVKVAAQLKAPRPPSKHKKGKDSKGSRESRSTTTTVAISPPQEDPVGFNPHNEADQFEGGDLIRGLLVPPPSPTITKQAPVQPDSLKSRPSVKRKWSGKDSSAQPSSGSRDYPSKKSNTLQKSRPNTPRRTILVSRTDQLAARVVGAYEKLVEEDNLAQAAGLPIASLSRPQNVQPSAPGTDMMSDNLPSPTQHRPSAPQSLSFHDGIIPSEQAWLAAGQSTRVPPSQIDGHEQSPVQSRHDTPFTVSSPPTLRSNQSQKGTLIKIGGAAQTVHHNKPYILGPAPMPPQGLGVWLPSNTENAAFDGSANSGLRKSSEIYSPFIATSSTPASPQLSRHRQPAIRDSMAYGASTDRRNSTGGSTAGLHLPSSLASSSVVTGLAHTQDGVMVSHPRLVMQHPSGAPPLRRSLSLLSTHSDLPNERASFQAEVDKLARIPTITSDDGGIRSTLAKLEGRSVSSAGPGSEVSGVVSPITTRASTRAATPAGSSMKSSIQKTKKTSHVQVFGHRDHPETSRLDLSDDSPDEDPAAATTRLPSHSSRATPDSRRRTTKIRDSSIALGLRTSSDVSNDVQRWSHVHAPTPRRSDVSTRPNNWPLVATKDFADKRPTTSQAQSYYARGPSATPQSSFLLNDDESLSSSEDDEPQALSRQISNSRDQSSQVMSAVNNSTQHSGHNSASTGDRSFFFDDEDDDSDEVITPQPRTAAVHSPPPRGYAPPMTPPPTTPLPRLPSTRPPASPRLLYEAMPSKAATRLLTPGVREEERSKSAMAFPFPSRTTPQPIFAAPMPPPKISVVRSASEPELSRALAPAHTPFILAFPSVTLAAQLTIIERDALLEVDWKELVNQSWTTNPPPITNWATYLGKPAQSGVDIVIARFNLVVKWVVSEILLTADVHDRALTIAKYVHIAAHARRMRNFATAYQITLALLASSVQRLRRTWLLVRAEEKAVLRHLEDLVQPTRNFARLRSEMEAALLAPAVDSTAMPAPPGPGLTRSRSDHNNHSTAPGLSVGQGLTVGAGACIPFIGVYTHDLAFNAQKPAYLDPDPSTASRPAGPARRTSKPVPTSPSGAHPGYSSRRPNPPPRSSSMGSRRSQQQQQPQPQQPKNQQYLSVPVAQQQQQGKSAAAGMTTSDSASTLEMKRDSSTVEPMVNFERFQTCAAIVKNLLRLLEASGRYGVRPHRELAGRCLWLAALDDADIERRSKALEVGQ